MNASLTEGDSSGEQFVEARVIGIPSAFRGRELMRSLQELGVPAALSEGVLVENDQLAAVDPRGFKTLLRRAPQAGEIGCALAHQRVYEQLDRTESSSVGFLIFEDDAQLLAHFDLTLIEEFLSDFGHRPAILMLHFRSAVVWSGRKGSPFKRAVVPPTTTTAYAITRPAIRQLAEENSRISHVADWPIAAFRGIEFFVPSSRMVTTPIENPSQIEGRPISGSVDSRTRRWIGVVTGARYRANRDLYGDYRTFVRWEVVRMAAFWIAERRRRRVGAELTHVPSAICVLRR